MVFQLPANYFNENYLNDEMLKKIEKSRCTRLGIGVESGSDRMLKLIKKSITVEQVKKTIQAINKTNIMLSFSFMIGMPEEKKEDMWKTLELMEFIENYCKKYYLIVPALYRPYPGNLMFQKAIELGHDKFTTSLLISPKKSQEKLEIIGEKLTIQTGVKFIFRDYRSGNGGQVQGERVKENSLYRQNYCGCLFGLTAQREAQKKIMDEMFNPISNQVLPESIEERLELYQRRNDLEDAGEKYKLIKQRFLNYRLLSGKVMVAKKIVPSYIMCYSTINRNNTNGRIEYEKDGINYLNRDEVKIIDINTFNKFALSSYKDVKELMYNPPNFYKELEIRNKIIKNPYDLSALIVIDEIQNEKYEIEINSETYEDIKEEII